jgi:putative endonuclease
VVEKAHDFGYPVQELPASPVGLARQLRLRVGDLRSTAEGSSMHTVYVLRSEKDGNLYIGCTEDIQERLQQHNAGRARSTKSRIPFVLIYTEEYRDKYEAFRMERFYKTAKGKRELRKKYRLPDRLMVGLLPLEECILVRIQVWQQPCETYRDG